MYILWTKGEKLVSFKDLMDKVQKSYEVQADEVKSEEPKIHVGEYQDIRDCRPSVFAIIYYDSKLNNTAEIKPLYDEFMAIPNKSLYFNGCKVSRFLRERLTQNGVEIRPSIKYALDEINKASRLYSKHSINKNEDFLTANMGGDAMTFMAYTELMHEYANCQDQAEVFECMKKEEAYLTKIKETRMQKEAEK